MSDIFASADWARQATDNKVADPERLEEGSPCPVEGCSGTMKWDTYGCTCHLGYPPCSKCVSSDLQCDDCGLSCEGGYYEPE